MLASRFSIGPQCRSSLSRAVLSRNIQMTGQRHGGQFLYFVQRPGQQFFWSHFAGSWGKFFKGFFYALALGFTCDYLLGVPEGPYYYDPEEFQPEEWEHQEHSFSRLVYKWILPNTSVAHWGTIANYKWVDEKESKDRLIQDVRRISSQIGATGLNAGSHYHFETTGGTGDRRNHIAVVNPQLLNEMIEYADEHDIKRSRDMIIRKVITEQGEGAWRGGIVVDLGQGHQDYAQAMKIPAPDFAPHPERKPEWYSNDVPTTDQKK
jgi:hypothetical protein